MVLRGVCKSSGVQLACCNLTVCIRDPELLFTVSTSQKLPNRTTGCTIIQGAYKKQKNCIEMEIGRREHKKGHMNHLSLETLNST